MMLFAGFALLHLVSSLSPPPCIGSDVEIVPAKCGKTPTGAPAGKAEGSYCAPSCGKDSDCPYVLSLTAACVMNQGSGIQYCEYKCGALSVCPHGGKCEKNIVSSICTYPSSPSPTPGPAPSPPPGPMGRKGSFLVIGDWGHDPGSHGNVKTNALQRAIAAQMLSKFRELGDVKFIVNLGDSFYPTGVTSKSDAKWQTRWRDIYAKELRSIPWYSVYGNHDEYDDWGCACGKADGSQCNQINSDISNKNFFYMPSVNWYREHPELDVEVVALDFNDVSEHPCTYGQASKCKSACTFNLASRGNDAEKLFRARYSASSHKNLLVFSHYPTDYFRKHHTQMLAGLKDRSKHNIDYFGGHRHNTDQSSTASIAPNNNWLVGGCGGWGCDGGNQGFVVGEITDTVKTYAVYANKGLCNRMMSEDLNATKVYV